MNAAMSIAEPFVPFFTAAGGSPAGRTKAAAKPTDRSGFVPTVSSPSTANTPPPFAPANATATPPPPPASTAPTAATAAPTKEPHVAHGKPVVTLQRDGDKVTRIRVQCGCGETIDLDCVY